MLDIGTDFNFAFPTAEIAVMGPEGAVNIIFRKELAEAENPVARRAELVAEYREEQMVGEKDIGLLQESGLLDH